MDGKMCHMRIDDGGWRALSDVAIHGESDIPGGALVGDLKPSADTDTDRSDLLPTLADDDRETVANELRRMVHVGGHSF